MYQKLDRQFLENWQYLSKEHIKDTRLVDLIIPGTHNSNTFTFDSYGSSFAQNQIWNIETQLQWGIRFLDLRYGLDSSTNYIVDKHGPISGKNYFANFESVKKFLEFHPNEFIIIKIQSEDELDEKNKLLFKKLMMEKIGKYLITSEDKWFDLSKVTMNHIWKQKKRVYLVYHNYLTKYPNCDKIGLFCALEKYQSFWHDTDDVQVLMDKNLEQLQQRKEFVDYQNVLFSNQFILTTQRGVGTIVSNIIVDGLPTIGNLMTKLHGNKEIVSFLLDNIHLPYNIIIMDRIDQDPYLCLLIVIQNLKSFLNVELSLFKQHDITSQTLPFVYNNKFIYISNFCQFLAESYTEQKHFTLIYKYEIILMNLY